MNKVKVIVQFSGGKDSQACLIKACEDFGANNVTAVFCDTGWEHEQTYSHVKEVASKLGVDLIILKNESVDGMYGLCKRMKWFPDAKNRMCTVQLKIWPMIDWILARDEQYKQRVIDLENEVNSERNNGSEASFFCKGKIPERFCNQHENGSPSFVEISDYVLRNENQPTLWDDTEPIMSCVSLYHGLCE